MQPPTPPHPTSPHPTPPHHIPSHPPTGSCVCARSPEIRTATRRGDASSAYHRAPPMSSSSGACSSVCVWCSTAQSTELPSVAGGHAACCPKHSLPAKTGQEAQKGGPPSARSRCSASRAATAGESWRWHAACLQQGRSEGARGGRWGVGGGLGDQGPQATHQVRGRCRTVPAWSPVRNGAGQG